MAVLIIGRVIAIVLALPGDEQEGEDNNGPKHSARALAREGHADDGSSLRALATHTLRLLGCRRRARRVLAADPKPCNVATTAVTTLHLALSRASWA